MGKIKLTKIKVSNSKFNSKVVLISDIHYSKKEDIFKLNKVLEKIQTLKPNYICILGDTLDEAKVLDEDYIINWLVLLSKISKVIMVHGNHDFALYKSHTPYYNEKLFNKISKIKNLVLLNNEMYEENGINFIGLNLGYDYYYVGHENPYEFIKHYNKLVTKLNNKNYNILLSHSPIALTRKEILAKLNDYKKIDLILCGHMHGGLMPDILRPIFKTRGILSPNKQNLFVKYAYGNFKIANINFMISSGITKLSHVSRFSELDKLFRPEIVSINLFDCKK